MNHKTENHESVRFAPRSSPPRTVKRRIPSDLDEMDTVDFHLENLGSQTFELQPRKTNVETYTSSKQEEKEIISSSVGQGEVKDNFNLGECQRKDLDKELQQKITYALGAVDTFLKDQPSSAESKSRHYTNLHLLPIGDRKQTTKDEKDNHSYRLQRFHFPASNAHENNPKTPRKDVHSESNLDSETISDVPKRHKSLRSDNRAEAGGSHEVFNYASSNLCPLARSNTYTTLGRSGNYHSDHQCSRGVSPGRCCCCYQRNSCMDAGRLAHEEQIIQNELDLHRLESIRKAKEAKQGKVAKGGKEGKEPKEPKEAKETKEAKKSGGSSGKVKKSAKCTYVWQTDEPTGSKRGETSDKSSVKSKTSKKSSVSTQPRSPVKKPSMVKKKCDCKEKKMEKEESFTDPKLMECFDGLHLKHEICHKERSLAESIEKLKTTLNDSSPMLATTPGSNSLTDKDTSKISVTENEPKATVELPESDCLESQFLSKDMLETETTDDERCLPCGNTNLSVKVCEDLDDGQNANCEKQIDGELHVEARHNTAKCLHEIFKERSDTFKHSDGQVLNAADQCLKPNIYICEKRDDSRKKEDFIFIKEIPVRDDVQLEDLSKIHYHISKSAVKDSTNPKSLCKVRFDPLEVVKIIPTQSESLTCRNCRSAAAVLQSSVSSEIERLMDVDFKDETESALEKSSSTAVHYLSAFMDNCEDELNETKFMTPCASPSPPNEEEPSAADSAQHSTPASEDRSSDSFSECEIETSHNSDYASGSLSGFNVVGSAYSDTSEKPTTSSKIRNTIESIRESFKSTVSKDKKRSIKHGSGWDSVGPVVEAETVRNFLYALKCKCGSLAGFGHKLIQRHKNTKAKLNVAAAPCNAVSQALLIENLEDDVIEFPNGEKVPMFHGCPCMIGQYTLLLSLILQTDPNNLDQLRKHLKNKYNMK